MADESKVETTFLDELSDDVRLAREALVDADTQAARRAYTRAVFATIEGIANHLKLIALDYATAKPELYSSAEIAILREETYALNAKGEAFVQPKFVRTEQNLLFALRMYMRDQPVEVEIDTTATGWQAFLSSLAVRHRVTHPRRIEDLQLSDREMRNLQQAYNWFTYTVVQNLLNAVTELKRRAGEPL